MSEATPRPTQGDAGAWAMAPPGRVFSRRWKAWAFQAAALAAIALGMVVLSTLLMDIVLDALPRLDVEFLTSFPSRRAESAGVKAALAGKEPKTKEVPAAGCAIRYERPKRTK